MTAYIDLDFAVLVTHTSWKKRSRHTSDRRRCALYPAWTLWRRYNSLHHSIIEAPSFSPFMALCCILFLYCFSMLRPSFVCRQYVCQDLYKVFLIGIFSWQLLLTLTLWAGVQKAPGCDTGQGTGYPGLIFSPASASLTILSSGSFDGRPKKQSVTSARCMPSHVLI